MTKSGETTSNIFDFRILCNDTLRFKALKKKENSLYSDNGWRISYIRKDTIFYTQKTSDQLKINDTYFDMESFRTKKITIDPYNIGMQISIKAAYTFSLAKKNFLLISAGHNTPIPYDIQLWLLFDVTNPEKILSFLFMDGFIHKPYEDNSIYAKPYCFNDFNNDGNLDYVEWNIRNDTLRTYTYQEKLFKTVEYFCKLKYTTEQKYFIGTSQQKPPILLDKKNSHWFHNLR